jgi:hypothetical protein
MVFRVIPWEVILSEAKNLISYQPIASYYEILRCAQDDRSSS